MKVRQASASEHEAIFMMGFDAWGDGATEAVYLERCRSSRHYHAGTWYVLAGDRGPVSSLIVYDRGWRLPANCHGIGSVATTPEQRGHGYASRLVTTVTRQLHAAGVEGVYLHADIDAAFYEAIGYRPVRRDQRPGNSVCMVHMKWSIERLLAHAPDYF